jgi:hypothetical protein
MLVKIPMLNFHYKFLNNTSIPIVLTENDSIINTVNIDEEIVKNKGQATFIRFKKWKWTLLLNGSFKNYMEFRIT